MAVAPKDETGQRSTTILERLDFQYPRVLLNAVYFKARWQFRIPPQKHGPNEAFQFVGSQKVDVPC